MDTKDKEKCTYVLRNAEELVICLFALAFR